MKKQTTVEWYAYQDNLALVDYLQGKINEIELAIKKTTILEKAKQMEKEYIINANRDGVDMCVKQKPFITGEEYYNKTFKTK